MLSNNDRTKLVEVRKNRFRESDRSAAFSLIHHSIENIVIGTLIKAFFQKYFLSVKVVACTE